MRGYRSSGGPEGSDFDPSRPEAPSPGKRALTAPIAAGAGDGGETFDINANGVGALLERNVNRGAPAVPVQLRGGGGSFLDSIGARVEPGAGGGEALPAPTRTHFESAFGADFGDVRIHRDEKADQLRAEAYTRGNDIHFAPGKYDPGSSAGQQLLGHELTHVVQQRGGQVQVQARGSDINADVSLEAEAEDLGSRAARGERVAVRGVGSGTQLKTSAETVAEAAITVAFTADKVPIARESGKKLAESAVAAALEGKIRAAAKARADKEAAKLASAATDEGTARKKSEDGSFKEGLKGVAAAERADVEAHGSSKDTGMQVERLAYEAGKTAGRAAATAEAEAIAEDISESVTDEALKVAVANTQNTIGGAVQSKVDGLQPDLIAKLGRGAVSAVGANPSPDPAALPPGVKTRIAAAVHAEGVDTVVEDEALLKAAKKAAGKQESSTKKAVEAQISSGVSAKKDEVRDAALVAASAAAHDKADSFRQVRTKVKQKVDAQHGLGPAMKNVSKALEASIPDAGDIVEIDALFSIPVPTAPPFVVTFHFVGSAERAGGAGAKNEDLVTLKMELLVGAGGNVGFGKLVGEIGGYVESCGAGVEAAFEQISYATYRRFRESSAIPAGIPNAIWGMGGETAGSLGISKGDAKRLEAEEWALGVEKRMIDSDREQDDDGNVIPGGGVGKAAYVEGGLKAGALLNVAGGAGKASAHFTTGRHMRGEGVGADAHVPTKETTSLIGNAKEKRGRGVKAINIGGAIKVGSFTSLEGKLQIKWFEKLEGEADTEIWVNIDGFGKMNLIKADKWVAFAMSAAAGLANLLALGRQAYEKYKGEEGEDAAPRAGGGVLGALASTEGMISEAAGNASALAGNAGNSFASEATELGLGSQTTVRMNLDYRGTGVKAWTIMLYQAKALDVNVDVAQVQGAAHKRLVQLTLLPSPRVEIPGFDLGGD